MNINDFKYLLVDSRSVFDPENTIFAALRTELGDGHRFIRELYDRGVRAFIAERRPEGCDDAQFILVDNVGAALGNLAAGRLAGRKGIVVTGSTGKTTMKELLYRAFLAHGLSVKRSPRSWNSSVGVPLSLWDMTSDGSEADVYITEAGIDAPGQAAFISTIIGPTHRIGVITPITAEHDEAFRTHADKIREKIALVAACDTIVYADSDPELTAALSALQGVRLVAVTAAGHESVFHALAAAVLELYGLSLPEGLPLLDKRREISGGAFGNTVIRDNFTPDLRSLREALDFMRRQATPSHESVLVLGNLLDGPGAIAEARDMASRFGVEKCVCLSDGETDAEAIAEAYHKGELFRNRQILLFGCPDGVFNEVAGAMEAAAHDTVLEVDLDALIHNYNYYRSLVPAGTGIVAMVKASAYGMGAIEIGKALQSSGAAYLAVAVIEEGIALRDAGITMPVMVLNPVTNRYPELFANGLEPAVFSVEELRRVSAEARACGRKNYPVHIKLDTGMHRVGFTEEQLPSIVPELVGNDAVRVASVFSHLATADCLDMDEYTLSQLALFTRMESALSKSLGYGFKRHILNTAGMMRFADTCGYEMARLGIGLYGISPYDGPEAANLVPVASFRSRIISLKHWPAGTPIGYGCKGHTTETDSVIATVPVGYADGVNRRLGNGRTCFVVNGVECPTIGNICMDLCMVDVTGAPDVKVGDEVEIFGRRMPVEKVASSLGTIPYELLAAVAPRVRRTYVKN